MPGEKCREALFTHPPTPSQLRLFSDRVISTACPPASLSLTWMGLTVDFIIHHPWFSLIQFGEYLWCACLKTCSWEMTDYLGPVSSPWGLWRQQNATCHNLQSQGFSHRRREHTPTSLEPERTLSITDAPELSEAEKGKATDWGPGQWPRGAVLTHRHQVAIILQHHIPIQGLLNRGQELPLLPCEVHGHISKCEGFL